MSDPIKVARGRSARVLGADFERRVRKDLEEDGWIIDKWSNQVETELYNQPMFEEDWKLVPAKHKFQQNGIPFTIGVGFPDFIVFRLRGCSLCTARMGTSGKENYTNIGVECKMNGKLSKIEKEKCRWLLNNNVFNSIKIAEKTKEKGKIVIVYHDFKEKYGS